MDLHNYQKARLKLFEDKRLNKVWLHPKNGDRRFPLPASKITIEPDFQTKELEDFQGGIDRRAAPAFEKFGDWTEEEYEAINQWVALHVIRNRKSRREFFTSPQDYNCRFKPEFYKELDISRRRYPIVHKYRSNTERFLVTSDHPVVDLQPQGESDYARCFAVSPEVLVLFSAHRQPPQFELPVEDFFNAMVYSSCDEFVFSHRSDVNLETLRNIAEEFAMFPVIE